MQETGDVGSIPASGRSSGGGNSNPLQYSLPGKFYRQRNLAGYSPQRCRVRHDWACMPTCTPLSIHRSGGQLLYHSWGSLEIPSRVTYHSSLFHGWGTRVKSHNQWAGPDRVPGLLNPCPGFPSFGMHLSCCLPPTCSLDGRLISKAGPSRSTFWQQCPRSVCWSHVFCNSESHAEGSADLNFNLPPCIWSQERPLSFCLFVARYAR